MSKKVWLMPSRLEDIVKLKALRMPKSGFAVALDEDEYRCTKEYRITIQVDAEGFDELGDQTFSTSFGDELRYISVPASVVKEK